MLNTSKDLIVPRRKATRPNLFHLNTFFFPLKFSSMRDLVQGGKWEGRAGWAIFFFFHAYGNGAG